MAEVMLTQKKRGKTEALRSLLLRLSIFSAFSASFMFFLFVCFVVVVVVVVVVFTTPVVVVLVFRAGKVCYSKLSEATQAYTPAIKRYKFDNQLKHY